MRCGFKPPKETTVSVPSAPSLLLPSTFKDWTTTAVTSVRDQGQCGSCWAFTAVAAIESMRIQNYSVISDLSEQQLVSCDTLNSGCNGGNMNRAFNYVKAVGLTTEAAYPYVSGTTRSTGTCRTTIPLTAGTPLFKISGYTPVSATCNAVVSAIQARPLSVAVNANSAWQSYKSGALSNCPTTSLNHAVLLVGYFRIDPFTIVWKIKNSWGTNWGMNGFILLNASKTFSTCGICSNSVSYPLK